MSWWYHNKLDIWFKHIPKTAGLSIRAGFFRGRLDGPHFEPPADTSRSFAVTRWEPQRYISAVRYCIREERLNKEGAYQEVLRILKDDSIDPSDLASSEGFIKHHCISQHNPYHGLSKVAHILRFHNLQDDWKRLCKMYNIVYDELPHLNKGER